MSGSGFEGPLFKRLPRNDTGEAPGHQAGFVVPRDLSVYFPELPAGTPEAPAPSIPIRAILMEGSRSLGTVDTVYQHQTWGGTRPPERRVTANLGALRNRASAGDILLIERSVDEDLLYRFTLVKQESPEYESVNAATEGRNWGVLAGVPPPATEGAIQQAETALLRGVAEPFRTFDDSAGIQRVARIARGRAFRRLVVAAYDKRCCMCGGGFINLAGLPEVEAAHIISRGARGPDDVRNGLALCRAHHWAFDQGLLGVTDERIILVKPAALDLPSNEPLALIHGRMLLPPQEDSLAAHPEALAWHRQHVFEGAA